MPHIQNSEIDTSRLHTKALELFDMIESKQGVVMLRGKAGIAKSATCKFIADNVYYKGEPLEFVDLRLSQMDETHFGFPYRKASTVGNFEVMNYALPAWFQRACEKPTLINFEELNRCSQDVQNAALEILNERTLHGHKLPDHVYMIATGNQGETDGCHVQDFDNALINRLIMVDFELPYREWCQYFAEKNVAPYVVDFLADNEKQHYYSPEDYFKDQKNDGKPFASPRSWTNLSDNLYMQASENDMIDFVKNTAKSFVGTQSANAFYQWLNDLRTVTVEKIINGNLHTRYFDSAMLSNTLSALKKSVNKGDIKTGNFTKPQKELLEKTFKEFI
jgi:hypothetical protein